MLLLEHRVQDDEVVGHFRRESHSLRRMNDYLHRNDIFPSLERPSIDDWGRERH